MVQLFFFSLIEMWYLSVLRVIYFSNEAYNKTVNMSNKMETIFFSPLIGFARLTPF